MNRTPRSNLCIAVGLIVLLSGCGKAVSPVEMFVIVPEDHDPQSPLPAVLWLHGWGQSARQDRIVGPIFQTLANRHQLGFIGVNGPRVAGDQRSAWAESVDEDFERIKLGLAEGAKKFRLQPGIAILGFSQGGTVGIEQAVRHPEIFAGAIAVSAGGIKDEIPLDAVKDRSGLGKQGFVIVCGDRENAGNVAWSLELATWLENNGGRVLRPSYPEHAEHSFPSDFSQRLPDWLAFVDKGRQ